MLRWTVLFAVVLAVSSTPTKCRNEGECLEARMHPSLPEYKGRSTDLNDSENQQAFWLNNAQDFVKTVTKRERNMKKAKNVIFFIGDGMGLSTLSAARVLKGGEEHKLSFEKFPDVGLAKTYSLDYKVPDSASTSTAYLGGVKGNYYTVGVNGHVEKGDCQAMQNEANQVRSIAQWAIDAGKSAGIVTTTRVTHASPAGSYAHSAHRDWENDSFIKKNCGLDTFAQDIANQLVHGKTGSEFKVIFGGGYREFVDKRLDVRGIRSDGRNLIEEWESDKPNSKFIKTLDEFHNLDVNEVDRVMGLFQSSHMLYHLEDTERSQPTLKEMTLKAIQMLQKNEEGYFLFVEGGKIDLAHHDTQAKFALDETLEFSAAIELAESITDDETLIVVSSDHSHTFSLAGYPVSIFYVLYDINLEISYLHRLVIMISSDLEAAMLMIRSHI